MKECTAFVATRFLTSLLGWQPAAGNPCASPDRRYLTLYIWRWGKRKGVERIVGKAGWVVRRALQAAALAFGLTVASVPEAHALDIEWGDGRWYVGFSVPVMFIDDTESTTTGNQALNPQQSAQRQAYQSKSISSYKTGFKVAGMVGYELGGGFRVEGELFFARAEVDRVTYKGVTSAEGSLPITAEVPIEGTADQYGAFASAWYDFRTGTNWIPYIGGGLGFIRIDQSDLKYDSNALANEIATAGARQQNPNAPEVRLPPGTVPEISTTDTVFAYHIGIGTGYRLTDNVILQGGYRLQAASDPEFEGRNRFGTVRVDTSLRVHLLEIGLRYRF